MFAAASKTASSSAPVYVEDVFSTYLYTGNGSTQTITNGIDLSGKGGLVWLKARSSAYSHCLTDTVQGRSKQLSSNNTLSANTAASNDGITTFNADGFSLGGANTFYNTNVNAVTFASWTFRKQAKFFDVVTYTGTGTPRTVPHNLGSVPGCMIIKRTSGTETGGVAGWWLVYHRGISTPQSNCLFLNSTDGVNSASVWDNTNPTSTEFTVNNNYVNYNGDTYVAYLFAHNAGGFGLTGTDNVISCGSWTGSGANIDLGYEPQWLLVKKNNSAWPWYIVDNMRGLYADPTSATYLLANSADAETTAVNIKITSTGFTQAITTAGETAYYIAIRRGPMKTPTSGTSVFTPGLRAGTSAVATVNAGFPQDSWLVKNTLGSANSVDWSFNFFDRLRSGTGYRLSTAFTNAEDTSINFITSYTQNGVTLPSTGYTATNGSGYNYIDYFFRRAPSFFDEVCYTGTGSATTFSHNLGVVPELMIFKSRSGATNWFVYNSTVTALKYLILQSTSASLTNSTIFNNTDPTSSVFTLGTNANINGSGSNFVAYLFASCSGVSKVGSYTGTGTTKQIDCGFTGGARFVMIKRTDDVGDWYVWDSARGIVSGNDPYLLLNSTAAEVTNTDYVDTYSAGFEISSTAPAAINANGGTFIFLAIA